MAKKEVINMSQLAIYIDNQLAERLDKAVKASGKSKSKWVADAIKRSLQDQWPKEFFDLAGSWVDDVGPDEIMGRIRRGMEKSDRRERLR
jgi:predicted DNA-binding protein